MKREIKKCSFGALFLRTFFGVIWQAEAAAAVPQPALHKIAFPLYSKVHMGDIL